MNRQDRQARQEIQGSTGLTFALSGRRGAVRRGNPTATLLGAPLERIVRQLVQQQHIYFLSRNVLRIGNTRGISWFTRVRIELRTRGSPEKMTSSRPIQKSIPQEFISEVTEEKSAGPLKLSTTSTFAALPRSTPVSYSRLGYFERTSTTRTCATTKDCPKSLSICSSMPRRVHSGDGLQAQRWDGQARANNAIARTIDFTISGLT